LPENFTAAGSWVFFTASSYNNLGVELYKTDGTAAGTMLVKDIEPGADSSFPDNLANLNGVLFFTANTGSSGLELWKSDGTEAGTVLVKDIQPGAAASDPRESLWRKCSAGLLVGKPDGLLSC